LRPNLRFTSLRSLLLVIKSGIYALKRNQLTSLIQKHINHRRFWGFYPFLIIIIVFPLSIGAQEEDYEIENFFIEEGLPFIRSQTINQDKNGLIWLCNNNQIYTFNGNQFELNVKFLDFSPQHLRIDNNGNKWVTEYSPLVADPWNATIKNIKILDDRNQELNLTEYLEIENTEIKKMFQGLDGTIGFLVDDEYYSFDKKNEALNLPEGTLKNNYIDKNLIVANNNDDCLIIDRTTRKIIHKYEGLLTCKVQLHKNILYLVFTTGEFYSFDIEKNIPSVVKEDFFDKDYLLDFVVDDWDNIWSIRTNKLYLLNQKTGEEIEFTKGHKYPSLPFSSCLFKDREGNIWVGTNTGINRIYRKPKTLFENSGALNYSTRNITELDDNNLFVSTYSGNYIYDLNTSNFKKVEGKNVITGMLEEDGFYYSISRQMQFRKDKINSTGVENQKLYTFEEKYKYGRYPGTLLKLSNGKKYLLLYHTVYEFDNDLNRRPVLENKSNTIFYHCAHEVDGEIYILTNKGIDIYDLDFNFKRKIFQDLSFRLLHIDSNNKSILWLSTPTKLIKFNTQTDFSKSFDLSSGFLNMNFTAIKEDNKGNLWLPSFTGLNRFNKNTGRNQVYLQDDGLSNNEFNNYSFTTLKDGRTVFGTISGLTFVDMNKLSESSIKVPEVQISNCKMLTSNLDSRKNITNQVHESSKLEFEDKDIESVIQLAHYSYQNVKSKKFKYRIFYSDKDPINEEWNSLSENEIVLGRMPYGKYLLQYQVESSYGNKLSEINQIEVHYLRPFYKSILFWLVGAIFLVLGMIYFINRRSESLIEQKRILEAEVEERTQQIQKQKQELENINSTKDKLFSILAHDLKSPLITLNNISGKINYLIKKNQPDRIIEIGKTIEDKVSNLTVFLDNLLNWAIQQRGHFNYTPQNLSIQNIADEIFELYDDIIKEKRLILTQNIPVDSSCYADENSIKTVVRNIIHNAIKYSPIDGTISINYTKGEEYNTLAISDMGAGIPKSIIEAVHKKEHVKNTPGTNGEKGTGLGFLISKELMDLNKGQMVFLSNKERGTTVELLLPVA